MFDSDEDRRIRHQGFTRTALDGYEIDPTFPLASGTIETGYASLAKMIVSAVRRGAQHIALDGFGGVPWEVVRVQLDDHCKSLNIELIWHDVGEYLLPQQALESLVAPSLGEDDPIFGKLFEGSLADFFDGERLQAARKISGDGSIVFYGAGAALACSADLLLYLDVPKDVIQQWMRSGTASNLGSPGRTSFANMYKRAYFVDWPALNRHKAQLLPDIDIFVDAQDPAWPSFVSGDALRASLDAVSTHPFRVRPWFFPGPWGGQWMKQQIRGLDQEAPNYAWSFELIVPENGLVFEGNGRLECSFDLLMFHAHERVLGRAAERFGYNFPIRFDYLDTIEGGNLSIQCHPRSEYITQQFGEPFTQDEAYYIVTCDTDAQVYLGFRDGVNPDDFRAVTEESRLNGTPIDVNQHVGSFPSHPHDLFLIPNGTIHSSGRGNLVLEISATPYIYTFKIYDWIRRDLEGNLRPLNIERAWENLYFERQEEYVNEHLRPQPYTVSEGPGWREVFVGTHDDIFYAVHRYELDTTVTVHTDNRCHVLNVVEGQAIVVETPDGYRAQYNNGETFVVPAATSQYALEPIGNSRCKVIKAFVK